MVSVEAALGSGLDDADRLRFAVLHATLLPEGILSAPRLIDEQGARIFKDGDDVLDSTSMMAFQRLMITTQEVNGIESPSEDSEKNV